MSTDFKLPGLGENIETAEVINVMVKPGDPVASEQPVIEVETEKAALEVPCSLAGTVVEVHVKSGDTISVGQSILSIDAAIRKQGAKPKPPTQKRASKPMQKSVDASKVAPLAEATSPVRRANLGAAASVPPRRSGPGLGFAAPSVRQFAREVGVDITQVLGSGPAGRVSVDDVKSHARSTATQPAPAAPEQTAPVKLPDFEKFGPINRQKMSALRRATAKHMAACWSNIPHVTLFHTADATELEAQRKQMKSEIEQAGGKLTITAILLKITADALRESPNVNASVDIANRQIILKEFVNIGVATDTKRGLLVPVVRDVDKKNVLALSKELTELSGKARAGKLKLAEMEGGGITITNLGGLGTGFFTPIVNQPEAAILGVGRARTEPVYIDNEFQPRLIMPLSLSFDHRIVDGAEGARFMERIINAIENRVSAYLTTEG